MDTASVKTSEVEEEPEIAAAGERAAIRALYENLLRGWNDRDAGAMAACFAEAGTMIGFDGSVAEGRGEIGDHLTPIFRDHPTAAFIALVRQIRREGDMILLRADAGMVPPGKADVNPRTNARQMVVARQYDGSWEIELFQNTPIAGMDEEQRDRLTDELQAAWQQGGILRG